MAKKELKIEFIKDWNKPDKDGTIHVPDYLDDAVNKVGMQFRFHKFSDKNEVQAIVDAVYNLDEFFKELYSVKNDDLIHTDANGINYCKTCKQERSVFDMGNIENIDD